VLGDRLHEARVLAELAEHRREDAERRDAALLGDASIGDAARGLRCQRQLLRQRIGERVLDFERLAGFVDAAQMMDPGCDAKRQQRDRRTAGQPLAQRVEQALRQLLRAVHRDLARRVLQGAVRKALQQALPVGVAIDPGQRLQGRRDLVAQQAVEVVVQRPVGDCRVDRREARHQPQVRKRRMAAVVRQVVARQQRERLARLALEAPVQPVHQEAERAARCVGGRQVVRDVGVGIPLFGDGQADDAGLRVGDARQHRRGVGRRDQQAVHRADHLQLFALGAGRVGVAQGERVQPILRRQCGVGVGMAQRHPGDAPAQVAAGV